MAHHRLHYRGHSCHHHRCCSVIHQERQGSCEQQQLRGGEQQLRGQQLPHLDVCNWHTWLPWCLMVSASHLDTVHEGSIRPVHPYFFGFSQLKLLSFLGSDWASESCGPILRSIEWWWYRQPDRHSYTMVATYYVSSFLTVLHTLRMTIFDEGEHGAITAVICY